jgi:hypothetical protein
MTSETQGADGHAHVAGGAHDVHDIGYLVRVDLQSPPPAGDVAVESVGQHGGELAAVDHVLAEHVDEERTHAIDEILHVIAAVGLPHHEKARGAGDGRRRRNARPWVETLQRRRERRVLQVTEGVLDGGQGVGELTAAAEGRDGGGLDARQALGNVGARSRCRARRGGLQGQQRGDGAGTGSCGRRRLLKVEGMARSEEGAVEAVGRTRLAMTRVRQ